MSKPRRYKWPELLAEFEQSGLSQVDFCKERQIDPKYFCQQRNKYHNKANSAFTQIQVQTSGADANGLTLQVGQCQVLCPASMPIPSLVSLVRALA